MRSAEMVIRSRYEQGELRSYVVLADRGIGGATGSWTREGTGFNPLPQPSFRQPLRADLTELSPDPKLPAAAEGWLRARRSESLW